MVTAGRHTEGMAATTITVSTELRDRLETQAAACHRTLGEHLEALSQEESRRDRFRAVRAAMTQTPPDDEYAREVREWQSGAWR